MLGRPSSGTSHLLPVVNIVSCSLCLIQPFHLEIRARDCGACASSLCYDQASGVLYAWTYLLTVATNCMGWWAANERDAFSLSSVRLACSVHNCLWFCVNLGKFDKCCIPLHSHFEAARLPSFVPLAPHPACFSCHHLLHLLRCHSWLVFEELGARNAPKHYKCFLTIKKNCQCVKGSWGLGCPQQTRLQYCCTNPFDLCMPRNVRVMLTYIMMWTSVAM